MPNMSKRAKLTLASVPIAAATTPAAGAVIDMQNFNGALFLFNIGTVAGTTNGGTVAVQASTASGGTYHTLASASKQFAGTDDDSGIAIDIWKPRYRYLRPLVTPTTTVEFGGCMVQQYAGRKYPVTHGTSSLVTGGVVLAVSTT